MTTVWPSASVIPELMLIGNINTSCESGRFEFRDFLHGQVNQVVQHAKNGRFSNCIASIRVGDPNIPVFAKLDCPKVLVGCRDSESNLVSAQVSNKLLHSIKSIHAYFIVPFHLLVTQKNQIVSITCHAMTLEFVQKQHLRTYSRNALDIAHTVRLNLQTGACGGTTLNQNITEQHIQGKKYDL
jgi:hypothetical protein